jgi:putative glutamine amidotransferase
MDVRARIALALSTPDTPVRRRARARYIAALEKAGAEVVPLAAGDELPEDFDAVCVSGGEDLDPSRYGEANEACEIVSPERDAVEIALVERARARDLPILGICRGFQVLNVAFGGSLVQHVDGHRPVPADGDGVVEHRVKPTAGSRLAEATTADEHVVNSRHHQAVTRDRLAPDLVATVMVGDLVEAFEHRSLRWVVGVQWHPERALEVDPAAARIFEAFVREAERVPAT